MSSRLTCRRLRLEALGGAEKGRMFDLMRANYDCVSRGAFERDLSWKDEVLALIDGSGVIQGFSTLALNPRGTGTPEYDILYSGDTIIAPAHWGSQELVRGFCRAAGRTFAERGKPLYWYLLSKGYRTYLYLPLFTHEYFPMPGTTGQEKCLRSIAERCSRLLFGDAWKPGLGVLQFAESQGQLNPPLAEDTHRRSHHPQVAFFLERNPGFAKGDELVCLAELSRENTRRIAGKYFAEGMELAGGRVAGLEAPL